MQPIGGSTLPQQCSPKRGPHPRVEEPSEPYHPVDHWDCEASSPLANAIVLYSAHCQSCEDVLDASCIIQGNYYYFKLYVMQKNWAA